MTTAAHSTEPAPGAARTAATAAVNEVPSPSATDALVSTLADQAATVMPVNNFVMRRWDLAHSAGDQAPPHRHHLSDEGFVVLRGRLEVLIGTERTILQPGDHVTIPAGTTHTFATIDLEGADVIAVMTPEVDQLVAALHAAGTDEERATVWERYNSALAPGDR
jgi:mannose-6-phosphate isomerase-like protein (cupin superfamily)